MTRHAAEQPNLTVPDALQAYADDTKGERKLTEQFRKWRTRALLGGTALTLVAVAGVRSLFGGGGEAPAADVNHNVSGGNTPASATESPDRTKERQAFECALDEIHGTKINSDGSATVEVVLKTEGAANATYHAVPYTGEGGLSGGDMPFLANNGAGAGIGSVSIPANMFNRESDSDSSKKMVGFYAESGNGEIDACGSMYVATDDQLAHFGDPTGDDLPAYHQ